MMKLIIGNYGFLVYVCGNWPTLWPARNMTLQNEVVQKVIALCGVKEKGFASFLLCRMFTLF